MMMRQAWLRLWESQNPIKKNWAANVTLHPDVVPSRGKFTGDFLWLHGGK